MKKKVMLLELRSCARGPSEAPSIKSKKPLFDNIISVFKLINEG